MSTGNSHIDLVRGRALAYTQKRFVDKKALAIIEDLLVVIEELRQANNSLAFTFDSMVDQIPSVLERSLEGPRPGEPTLNLLEDPRESN
jgi:hypothetical protein